MACVYQFEKEDVMAQPDFHLFTVQEYLWEEEHSRVKREYRQGQVYNISGGSPEHSQIALNLAAGLKRELRGKFAGPSRATLKWE